MRQQGGFFYSLKVIIILAIVGAGFFCGEKALASQSILINEALIKPLENRFIELYNSSSSPVDLTGWYLQRKTQNGTNFDTLVSKTYFKDKTIGANSYFLISRTSMANADIVINGLTLAGSDTIRLKKSESEIIDTVFLGLAPDDGKSLERKDDGSWQVSQNIGGTPKAQNTSPQPSPLQSGGQAYQGEGAVCGNGQVESGEQCDDGNLVSGDGCSSTCQTETVAAAPVQNNTASSTDLTPSPLLSKERGYNFGDVLINELVSDPADNEVEWIELYNKLNKEIDLSGWWLEDGAKTKTNLSGVIGVSGSERFKVIEKPNGNLNNDGDLIALYDASGKIIDQVAYGNWDDGNLNDNAPVAHDPNSVARKFDGYNSYNNLNDFAVTLKPTKGASNIIQTEDEVGLEARAKYDFSEDIYFTEILPNPTGDDAKNEFIEIYNAGKRAVDLTGWSLSNEDNKKINLEKIATSTKIQAGEYLAFFRPKTKIVLHNDQGEVRLFQPLADKPLQIVKYKNVKEGWSYDNNRGSTSSLEVEPHSDEWVWSETPTPGAANVIKAVNHAPEAEFSFKSPALINTPVVFDSSDSSDADGDQLTYLWDFGDGFKNNLASPEHVYSKVGIYKVKLEVNDGKVVGKKEKSVKVGNSIVEISDVNEIASSPEAPRNDKIIINEVFPNPKGADTGQEWLELKNQSLAEISLLNWRVENQNGKYEFNGEQLVAAGAFYVLNNTTSKLAFKNTSDVINLYNDLDELADTVEYANAVAGESYARGANGSWFWTTVATPGKENVISVADSKSINNPERSGRITNKNNDIIETTLEKVRELEIGSLVKVKGTVAVEPGILGAQIFYIVGSPGVQIYNYQKDFPILKVGDYVEVSGELALAQGELRIKTKEKTDIKINEHKPPPVALALTVDNIGEENVGQLMTVSGEITDKKSSTLYLDDGNDEILVYIKKNTGISTKGLTAGQNVAITGILSKTNSGLRLMPRYQNDIAAVETAGGLEPQVLGEVAAGQEWDLAERDKKTELFKYLLIISAGVIMVLAGLFIRAKRTAK